MQADSMESDVSSLLYEGKGGTSAKIGTYTVDGVKVE